MLASTRNRRTSADIAQPFPVCVISIVQGCRPHLDIKTCIIRNVYHYCPVVLTEESADCRMWSRTRWRYGAPAHSGHHDPSASAGEAQPGGGAFRQSRRIDAGRQRWASPRGYMNYLRIALQLLIVFAAKSAFADWLALAIDDGGAWGISVRQSSKKQAESVAMKQCSKGKRVKCRAVGSSDRLGYVAVATSPTSVRAELRDTLEDAKRSALDECAKHTSTEDTCEIQWTGVNGAFRERQRASSKAVDCRPQTREIRCRSNCVNGNCVVEYENGCKIRVQVSPRFDFFSNQWTYPSPSC